MPSIVSIYTGDGKGKTTASLGICLRYTGAGGTVLYTQFLKNDVSSEINILNNIPQITFLPSGRTFGFSFQMSDIERRRAAEHYTAYLEKIIALANAGRYGMLVLDEIFAADNGHFIPHEMLIQFLKQKPLNVVLTGRNPADDIILLADSVTEIKCRKHPFTKGVPARTGIEK